MSVHEIGVYLLLLSTTFVTKPIKLPSFSCTKADLAMPSQITHRAMMEP